jgi:7,8-dihydro-6-hydroxymethylpterin-pyrophosphokinase
MELDPTILRSRTSTSLLHLLVKCKKFLNLSIEITDSEEANLILKRIQDIEDMYAREKNLYKNRNQKNNFKKKGIQNDPEC